MLKVYFIIILVCLAAAGGYFIYSGKPRAEPQSVWPLLKAEHQGIKRLLNALWQVVYKSEADKSLPSEQIYNSIKESVNNLVILSHFPKEEKAVYSYFKAGPESTTGNALKQAQRDHDDIRRIIAEINLAYGIKNPVSFTQNMMGLISLLTEHIFREDESLFPGLKGSLSENEEAVLLKRYNDMRAGEDKSGVRDLYKFYIAELEKEYGVVWKPE